MEPSEGFPSVSEGVLRVRVGDPTNWGAVDLRSLAVARELLASRSPNIRSVLLLGADDRLFCSGGNVRDFRDAQDVAQLVSERVRAMNDFILALEQSGLPSVAAVRGWAVGAGLSLAVQCDVVVGGQTTAFRAGYLRIGFTPDGGLTWFLPRAIGRQRATNMILSNRVIGGEEARDWGLLHILVDDNRVSEEAEKSARDLADAPTGVVAETKRLIASPRGILADQLEDERAAVSRWSASRQSRERVRDFLLPRQG